MTYFYRGLAMMGAAIVVALPAHARNEYLFAAGLTYPAITTTQLYDCALCHSSGDNRNPYGMAFEANGHNFQAIENLDSDSDGFSNITEIDALTWPGNPLSFPIVFGTLDVTKPSGATDWVRGTKALVKWTSSGDVGQEVSVELWKDGSKVKTLKKSTSNDGKQKVKLKQSVPAGTGYTVRVRSLLDKSIVGESSATITVLASL